MCYSYFNKDIAASPAGATSSSEASLAIHRAEDPRLAGAASQAVQENYLEAAGQPYPVPDGDLAELDISGGVLVPVYLESDHGDQEEPGKPLEVLMLLPTKKCCLDLIGYNSVFWKQGRLQLNLMAQAQTLLDSLHAIALTDPPMLRRGAPNTGKGRRPLMGL